MSEGDSVGESIHGKPSVVAAFFTRIGQVKCLSLMSIISHNCFVIVLVTYSQWVKALTQFWAIQSSEVVSAAFLSVFWWHGFFLFIIVTGLSVMAWQVNTILCGAMGSHSTTYCCLHDQSVHTTGNCVCVLVSEWLWCWFLRKDRKWKYIWTIHMQPSHFKF